MTINNQDYLSIKGAKEHNLKNVYIDLPRYKLIVFTGVSGSGKSSLAFDTIYNEGRRRYIESLSSYARQFLEVQSKPDVESISGLSPAIAIDQRSASKNPRSTVATVTEIYDYMRILFARVGIPYSPATNLLIEKQTPAQMVERIINFNSQVTIIALIVNGKKGEHRKELVFLRKQGSSQLRINNIYYTFEELPILDKNKKHTIEVIVAELHAKESNKELILSAVTKALKLGDRSFIVEYEAEGKKNTFTFSEKFTCPISGFSLTDIEPRLFSFNSPYGACIYCDGLGKELFFDPALIIPQPNLSLKEGAIAPVLFKPNKISRNKQLKFYDQTIDSLAKHYQFSVNQPFNELPKEIQHILLYGAGEEKIEFLYDDGVKEKIIIQEFPGILANLESIVEKSDVDYLAEEIAAYQNTRDCKACQGFRLKPQALCIKIDNKHVGDITAMSIHQALSWMSNLTSCLNDYQKQIAELILKELIKRLKLLEEVGLEYITLNRRASTLSGGESQRIRLASQIGSGLSGVLYVLDEPSIGLHQADNDKLLGTLKNLRDLGNTVIVVEHDEDTMLAADYIVDVGPEAGINGGYIVAQGTPQDIQNSPLSLTGKYLSGNLKIEVPKKRREFHNNPYIEVRGARANNLKNINVKIPIGTFIAVTGISGSGKSTFTIQTLYRATVRKLHGSKIIPGEYDKIIGLEYLDKVIEVDQSPIGRTPRSNPATYTAAFTPIRDWFTSLPESRARGYNAGRFSFNVKGGRCDMCEGDGVVKIEMYFLPDVYVKCEECKGTRYNLETLEIKYNGQSIADVLQMTTDKASEFFKDIPLIHEKLVALQEVGLGYMQIGQSATTLSGGEAQRVKLAKELARKSTGRTLYIFDEPTTGLHSHDIKQLLSVLDKLVNHGNTVIVIEHNLDVIKTADYILDMGPFAGDKGGELVAVGSPEEIVKSTQSITGKYLKKYLNIL